jgi:hypothetical protein
VRYGRACGNRSLHYSDRKYATVSFVTPVAEDDLERDAMRTLRAPESDRLEAHFQLSGSCRELLQATHEHVAAVPAAALRIRRDEKILMPIAPVLVAILTLVLAGCAESTNILAAVKAGTLPSTTKSIGKAFDEAFPGGTWDASTTGMGEGEMLAEFHSTTTAEALESSGVPHIDRKDCLDGVKSPCRIQVSFQFTLAPDLRSVSLALVKAPEPMQSGEQLTALLGFVYR